MTPALQLTDITAGYGETTVLRNVTLSVQPGELVALLGPNGAGKTTALRTASGILKPKKGEVEINGVRVTREHTFNRVSRGLCLIPEGRGIFRSLSVRENLRLHTQPGKASGSGIIERAIEVFPDLRDRLNEQAGRLSGGQQQMLSLARAYIADPSVVLLDEVSMGLAPRVVDAVFEALHKLASTGIAMLLVEQYVTRAMEMADRVVLLNKGEIVHDGPSSGLDEDAVFRDYMGLTS